MYSTLTLAGVTPFIAAALLPAAMGIHTIEPLGRLDHLASSYGTAIICFLTGVHWATQLYEKSELPVNLFIASNLIFLATWITYLAMSLVWALGTQIVAFSVLLAIDFRLQRSGLISSHYLRIRVTATALACLSLLSILISL